MSSGKWVAVVKEAADYFSAATTVLLFLFSALGAIVSIPLAVTFPVAGAVGLICSLAGAKRALRQYRERKAEQQREMRGTQQKAEAEHNITVIAHKLQHDLREIEASHHSLLRQEVEVKVVNEDDFDDRLLDLPEEKHEYHLQLRFFAAPKPANDPQIMQEEKRHRALSL